MEFCKNKQISNFCQPNALLTLQEYLEDYASPETKVIGEELIEHELYSVPSAHRQEICRNWLIDIRHGKRDFRF